VRAGDLALKGHHQRTNAALASALLEAAAQVGLRVEPRHVEAGLRTARWPARLEQFGNVLVDGAHNPHAVSAVVRALPALLAGRQVHAVFGALQDKDAAAMLALLAPVCASMHYCAPESPRAYEPQALASLQAGAVYTSARAAMDGARRAAGRDGVVLCLGSLYLAAEVRALLLGESRTVMPSERL
jgi:dihydrofolate synthase/folylpolyglutamate synthase